MKAQIFGTSTYEKFALTLTFGVFLFVHVCCAQSTPTVQCKILNCIKPSETIGTSPVCDGANGDHITLQINVKWDGSLTIDAGSNIINPVPTPSQGTYYVIKVVRQADNIEVPIRCFDTGSGSVGGGRDGFSKRVELEIPESQVSRRAKLQAWWNKVKAQASPKDRLLLNTNNLKDEDILDGLDHYLLENQSGKFKVVCSYISAKPKSWNGEIQSSPVFVNVVKTGTILDKNQP